MKKFVVCIRTVMYLLALTLGFQSCDKDDDPLPMTRDRFWQLFMTMRSKTRTGGRIPKRPRKLFGSRMTPSAYSVWNRANRSER